MPEGPELHLASRFVNEVCRGRVFAGPIVKSAVSTKNPDIEWTGKAYTITATSRGKEVRLTLSAVADNKQSIKKKICNPNDSVNILFRFGMSGKFQFTSVKDMHKHAHLNFYTKDGSNQVLSFVDYRRFGRWEVTDCWGADRGPCVLFEFEKFRHNVLNNLKNSAFNRPICEALLNQKFFNGIGNYLRAEILYRLSIPPFASARSVLEPLSIEITNDVKVKKEVPDILDLCNMLPLEVINLGGKGYDPEGGPDDYDAFSKWLRCYYNNGMNNMVDHNGRTIWFHGPAGPMAPREGKSRGMIKSSPKKKKKTGKQVNLKDVDKAEVKGKKQRRTKKPSTPVKERSRRKKKPKTVEPINNSMANPESDKIGNKCATRLTRSAIKRKVGSINISEQEGKSQKPVRVKGRDSGKVPFAADSDTIFSTVEIGQFKCAKMTGVETADVPRITPSSSQPKRRSARNNKIV